MTSVSMTLENAQFARQIVLSRFLNEQLTEARMDLEAGPKARLVRECRRAGIPETKIPQVLAMVGPSNEAKA